MDINSLLSSLSAKVDCLLHLCSVVTELIAALSICLGISPCVVVYVAIKNLQQQHHCLLSVVAIVMLNR